MRNKIINRREAFNLIMRAIYFTLFDCFGHAFFTSSHRRERARIFAAGFDVFEKITLRCRPGNPARSTMHICDIFALRGACIQEWISFTTPVYLECFLSLSLDLVTHHGLNKKKAIAFFVLSYFATHTHTLLANCLFYYVFIDMWCIWEF